MITVEDLLKAYASAYDAWLDPDAERKEPTPEYAELIRQAVSFENAKLRELVRDIADHIKHDDGFGIDRGWVLDRIRELGIEVDA